RMRLQTRRNNRRLADPASTTPPNPRAPTSDARLVAPARRAGQQNRTSRSANWYPKVANTATFGYQFAGGWLALGAHEHRFERVERLEAAAGAENDAFERRVDEMHREVGLFCNAAVEAAQHAAAADEVDALHDQVLRQFGRGLAEAGHDRV